VVGNAWNVVHACRIAFTDTTAKRHFISLSLVRPGGPVESDGVEGVLVLPKGHVTDAVDELELHQSLFPFGSDVVDVLQRVHLVLPPKDDQLGEDLRALRHIRRPVTLALKDPRARGRLDLCSEAADPQEEKGRISAV
jgi:hypothetical protein